MSCLNTIPIRSSSIVDLCQVVHLDTPVSGYVMLTFKHSKSAQVSTRAMCIIHMAEEQGL